MQKVNLNLKLKFKKLNYGIWLALLLPLFAVMPLLTNAGLPNTADGPAHLMRQAELNRAWQEGNFYPRWGTDLALGHGMPIFSYAPPSLYHLTQLFHLTGLPLDEAMKAVLVADFLLYSLGMFLFARRIFGPAPALVAAAAYVYAPYRLREAYIQGNYGQFTGLAFYPLICWAFHGLITDGRPRYLVAAAVSLAGLLLSHNISSMIFAPLLAAYLLFLLITNRLMSKREGSPESQAYAFRSLLAATTRTAAGGLLGLGLAAIFWLPAFGERDQIKLEGITRGFFDFRENFISLSEFLSPPLPLDLAAINPEFPLSLGWPQILAAGLGMISLLFVSFRSADQAAVPGGRNRVQRMAHTLFFSLFLLLYAYLVLPYSQPVWESVPLLELAEFPWRMLGPAIFCASFLAAPGAALFIEKLTINRKEMSFIIVNGSILVIIALNLYYLYPTQFIPWGTPTPADAFHYEVVSGAIGTTSTGEFLPRAAQRHPEPDTLWPDYEAGRPPQKLDPATLPPGAIVKTISHRSESDSLAVNTPQEFVATLRTLYWPGWQLYLNGEPWSFSVTPQTGLIQTTIPPGQHTLILRLESTPLRSLGQGLSLVSLILLIVIGLMALIRARQPAAIGRGPRAAVLSPRFFALSGVLLAVTFLLSRPLAPLFTLRSDPDRPRPADQILQIDFEDQLRLVGRDDLPLSVQLASDEMAGLTATVYWRALQEVETNYAVFLHLDVPNGQTVATVDERHPENIPTRNWPPGLYLRNPLHLAIPAGVPPIRYDLNLGVYDPERNERLVIPADGATTYRLGSIWVTVPPPELTRATPIAHFGPHLALRQVDPPTVAAQMLTLYWQATEAVEEDYSIFIHLLDPEGKLLGQLDGVPYGGFYPLPNWLPGQTITDVRPLPAIDLAQLDSIAIGIYDPATGDRLPATDDQGKLLPHNSLTIPVTP
jgi:hypothetical protein